MTALPQQIDASGDPPTRRARQILALSGFAFAVLFAVGTLTSSANTPHYTAVDQAWKNWAHDNEYKGRISAFSMLLAAFVFFYFVTGIRTTLEQARSRQGSSVHLARVAFTGAITGTVGITIAFVSIANASSEGIKANPAVSRAVLTGAGGPFLIAAMGFAAFLISTGVLTLRTGVFARWTGIVALIGAAAFLTVSLTIIGGTGDGNALGYAFFPAILSLIIWTIGTSAATYRAA